MRACLKCFTERLDEEIRRNPTCSPRRLLSNLGVNANSADRDWNWEWKWRVGEGITFNVTRGASRMNLQRSAESMLLSESCKAMRRNDPGFFARMEACLVQINSQSDPATGELRVVDNATAFVLRAKQFSDEGYPLTLARLRDELAFDGIGMDDKSFRRVCRDQLGIFRPVDAPTD